MPQIINYNINLRHQSDTPNKEYVLIIVSICNSVTRLEQDIIDSMVISYC